MELNVLIQRLRLVHQYFSQKYQHHTQDFRILARLGKISEELGELNSAVHSELGMQRQEKLDLHKTEDIATEWADLLNTVILFGIVMDIDMPKAIDQRLNQIMKRYQLDSPNQSS